MRSFPISMSKAARGRLNLLQRRNDLALPLDPEDHKPFDFVFRDDIMVVTFEGRAIASVPKGMNENGKSFDLAVHIPENSVADMALTRFFDKLTQHLNRVGSILSAQQREEKLAEQQQSIESAERERADGVRLYEQMQPFLTTDQDLPLPNFTRADFNVIMRFNAQDDVLYVSGYRDTINVSLRNGFVGSVKFTLDGDTVIDASTQFSDYDRAAQSVRAQINEAGQVLDMRVLAQHLGQQLERNCRLMEADPIVNFIRNLPETEYSMEAAILNRLSPYVNTTHDVVIDAEFAIHTQKGALIVMREGGNVAIFDIHPREEGSDLREALMSGVQVSTRSGIGEALAPRLNADDLQRIGELWIATIAERNPTRDMSIYKKADPDAIAQAFTADDAGYGF